MSLKEMKKDDLELLSYKDITNLLIEEEGPKSTPDLFKRIVDLLELNNKFYESKIGDYYMMLTTDKRFILLDDGCWDLRSKYTSDKFLKVEEEDDELENEESGSKSKDETDETNEDYDINDEYDEDDDDYKDLVILDEDELDLEQ